MGDVPFHVLDRWGFYVDRVFSACFCLLCLSRRDWNFPALTTSSDLLTINQEIRAGVDGNMEFVGVVLCPHQTVLALST